MPGHWRVIRKAICSEVRRNHNRIREKLLIPGGLTQDRRASAETVENYVTRQIKSKFGKYKLAAPGDVAYNMMRTWQGATGVSPVDGIVSPAYVVARPYARCPSWQFFVTLFRTGGYMSENRATARAVL